MFRLDFFIFAIINFLEAINDPIKIFKLNEIITLQGADSHISGVGEWISSCDLFRYSRWAPKFSTG